MVNDMDVSNREALLRYRAAGRWAQHALDGRVTAEEALDAIWTLNLAAQVLVEDEAA